MAKVTKPERTERINIPLFPEEKKQLDQAVSLRMNASTTRVGTYTEWAREILMTAVDDILEKAKKS